MPKNIVIGIAGGTASGKTSVARKIHETLGGDERVAMIQQDMYYVDLSHVPAEHRMKHNLDHPDAFDAELMLSHLQALKAGRAADIPVYDHRTHSRSPEARHVDARRVILLDGILILHDARVRDLMDIKVFIDTDADLRFIRRFQRDVYEMARPAEHVIEQYIHVVRPMHEQFVEPSKRYADVIIPHGVENRVGVDILMTKIRTLLESKA
jgi:uridine kinase